MATASDPGARYITAEVQLWWDDSTGRVHVTSNGRDFGPAGLHTNIKPGTAAERSCRTALAKLGKPDGR